MAEFLNNFVEYMVNFDYLGGNSMYFFLKRLLDIIFAMLLLIILIPLFLIVGLWIKLETQGPVFFKQKRSGKSGSYFYIYKFRSMKKDTPNLATDQLDDPSSFITPLGVYLRKTSIDELPQLINILRGEMSFVGPRPALYNQYELIQSRKACKVDQIIPGLTGYAQVMGRDSISDEIKINYDKYYLDHHSLLFDFKIICLTFLRVIKAENIRE